MHPAEFFNAAYSRSARYWWQGSQRHSTDPRDHAGSLMTQFILRHVREQRPGRALDLGSGEGADAIRLALMGWKVDAVEISSVGAEKIERFAYEAGVDVAVHNSDVTTFTTSRAYDLIICNGVLHYIREKDQVIRTMQELTVPGGCNAISCWSTFSPVPECHGSVPAFPDDENGVITHSYRDWEALLHYFERGRLEGGHTDMPQHVHSHIKTVMVKPADRGAPGAWESP